MEPFQIICGEKRLDFEYKPLIMGIVNITPDSFSDGGVFFDPDSAVAHGLKLVNEGADILDIGGESTRPFSQPVSVEEEIRRVVPVINALAGQVGIPISIDTTKAEVAEAALAAGAGLINDISALRMDEKMAEIVRSYQVPVILMHMLGTPKTMQIDPVYDDLIGEVHDFLKAAIDAAEQKGIDRNKIIIDPGIGFGKTPMHNLLLIRHIAQFRSLGCPILIGPSRKAFIRHLLKKPAEKELAPNSPMVEAGTQAVVAISAMNGANIFRVHDVAATQATLKILGAIQTASMI
ncbi:MAG: dihydropteroate synthase [Desulfobacterales bacterium]|jgi:dihydropteroate synthase|nr:dihydropteroate synthase [Desulfobacterales bacterium]